MSNKEGAYNY